MEAGHTDPYTRRWPNTIAICSIMKDEHIDDVKEFIAYHRCERWQATQHEHITLV